jgi:hypothetical protein
MATRMKAAMGCWTIEIEGPSHPSDSKSSYPWHAISSGTQNRFASDPLQRLARDRCMIEARTVCGASSTIFMPRPKIRGALHRSQNTIKS